MDQKEIFFRALSLTERERELIYDVYQEVWIPPIWISEIEDYAMHHSFSIKYQLTETRVKAILEIEDKRPQFLLSVIIRDLDLTKDILPEYNLKETTNKIEDLHFEILNKEEEEKSLEIMRLKEEMMKVPSSNFIMDFLLFTEDELNKIYNYKERIKTVRMFKLSDTYESIIEIILGYQLDGMSNNKYLVFGGGNFDINNEEDY